MKRIIIASQNKHKIEEIEAITKKFGMSVVSRNDAGLPNTDIEEDGKTFEENSYKKAYEIMRLAGEMTIADDSGLMVDALGGAPGVYSARFSGDGATDRSNNEKLLFMLKDVPAEKRTAKFVSVITMIYPDGDKIVARGECPGSIIFEERGQGGFGYDPLFVPDGYDKTFGELGAEEKNKISHRARALVILEKELKCREKDL
ncbi:MAG: XTP/dITP diphosphatase [Firmicutes bacterium]|nr:XTP/dITP diphosphatase [Bacillota bacterium]